MFIEGEKIELIVATCKEHGEFAANPANHLAGEGCPVCDSGHASKAIIEGFDEPVNIRCTKYLH